MLVGGLLKKLPSDNFERTILSASVERYCNGKIRPLTRQYEMETERATIGAETTLLSFAEVFDYACGALRIPSLKASLICEPEDIFRKVSEEVCCSKRFNLQNSSKNEAQTELGKTQDGSTSMPVETRIVKPDITVYNSRANPLKMPLMAMEAKKPGLEFSKALQISDDSSSSAPHKVKMLFERLRRGAKDLVSIELVLGRAICQAVVYALHSESQCAILTNYNETLFFRVASNSSESSREVKVAVSSLYQGGSVFCGIVASLRKVFSKDYSSSIYWGDRVTLLRRLNEEDPDYFPPDASPDDRDNSNEVHDWTGSSAGEDVSAPGNKRKMSLSVGFTATRSPLGERKLGRESQSSLIPSNHGSVHRKKMRGYALYAMMNRNFGFLSEHGLNRVLKCRMNDIPVAVKYFFSLDERKHPSRIDHERHIHALMEERCDNGKYGEFVSKLLAYGSVRAFGTVLTTEYVGKGVILIGSHILVGGEVVLDVEELASAALKSLRWVHRLGLLHGDVRLQNMRAKRNSDWDWQVWWLDFGNSRESRSKSAFRDEEGECRAMFKQTERTTNCLR